VKCIHCNRGKKLNTKKVFCKKTTLVRAILLRIPMGSEVSQIEVRLGSILLWKLCFLANVTPVAIPNIFFSE